MAKIRKNIWQCFCWIFLDDSAWYLCLEVSLCTCWMIQPYLCVPVEYLYAQLSQIFIWKGKYHAAFVYVPIHWENNATLELIPSQDSQKSMSKPYTSVLVLIFNWTLPVFISLNDTRRKIVLMFKLLTVANRCYYLIINGSL